MRLSQFTLLTCKNMQEKVCFFGHALILEPTRQRFADGVISRFIPAWPSGTTVHFNMSIQLYAKATTFSQASSPIVVVALHWCLFSVARFTQNIPSRSFGARGIGARQPPPADSEQHTIMNVPIMSMHQMRLRMNEPQLAFWNPSSEPFDS